MPRFEDTPKYKRDARWDPELKRLVYKHQEPTVKQLRLLRELCKEVGRTTTPPRTKREAATQIDRLLKVKRKRSSKPRP